MCYPKFNLREIISLRVDLLPLDFHQRETPSLSGFYSALLYRSTNCAAVDLLMRSLVKGTKGSILLSADFEAINGSRCAMNGESSYYYLAKRLLGHFRIFVTRL